MNTSRDNRTTSWTPRFIAELLGVAVEWATVDKTIWGCDGYPDGRSIEAFKEFQSSEELIGPEALPPGMSDKF